MTRETVCDCEIYETCNQCRGTSRDSSLWAKQATQPAPAWAEEHMRKQRAEIERLQGHMRALADTSVARDTAGIFKGLWQGSERECEELRAEVERLKAAEDHDLRTKRAYRAEIERLQKSQCDCQPKLIDLRADLEAEIERLTLENWQLKGALGYPVPGDIPQGPFKCGLCEARALEIDETPKP